MAAGSNYRQQNRAHAQGSQFYVYGNTVSQAEAQPVRRQTSSRPAKTRRTSRQVRKNRNRAMKIGSTYARFFIIAAVCAVIVCVMYLRLQSEVVKHSENITSLQEELADLKEANDTAYNAAVDSVNLETVREKAMNELGMVYEDEGNVVHYKSPTSDYVKQYDDIPEDGVLAQSKDMSK